VFTSPRVGLLKGESTRFLDVIKIRNQHSTHDRVPIYLPLDSCHVPFNFLNYPFKIFAIHIIYDNHFPSVPVLIIIHILSYNYTSLELERISLVQYTFERPFKSCSASLFQRERFYVKVWRSARRDPHGYWRHSL
jgi:hypothetical protein